MTRHEGRLSHSLFLYPIASMIWRWESQGRWLWSCRQEDRRTSLLFASSLMHSIAFDVQSTGSLLISMMDNSILLINIIFIISIMWPLPGIPLGRRAGHDWVFCCWRANEESHETICGDLSHFWTSERDVDTLYFLTTELLCWSQIPFHTGFHTMNGALGLWNFLGDTRLLLTSSVSSFTAPAVWESFL